MEISNSFEVTSPLDETWAVLTDVERIAPCLPGAKLTGASDDEYQGMVKVKVGPITVQYRGTATFSERDDSAHRAVIVAKGRDTRGAGNASATITAQLEAIDSGSTRVNVHTDMAITGKVAQFGRGVMADVSAKLMAQFADNLAELIAASGDQTEDAEGSSAPQAASSTDGDAASSAPQSQPAADGDASAGDDDVEAVDLLSVAGAPVLKRLVPLVAVVAVIVVVIILVAVA